MAYCPTIRVTLNERSTDQLQTIMSHYQIGSATHMIQKLIGSLYSTLPIQEVNNDTNNRGINN